MNLRRTRAMRALAGLSALAVLMWLTPMVYAQESPPNVGDTLVLEAEILVWSQTEDGVLFPMRIDYLTDTAPKESWLQADCVRLGAVCGPGSILVWVDEAGYAKLLLTNDPAMGKVAFAYTSTRIFEFPISGEDAIWMRYKEWKSDEQDVDRRTIILEVGSEHLMFRVLKRLFIPSVGGGVILGDDGARVGHVDEMLDFSIDIETR